MVNLKKIGVIATGALFVGATVGMAAAVTVPSDFKASMLAENGVAKAQLVVGKDAPGKADDTASAEVIAEAAKEKLKVSGAGGDIKITYGGYNLDDEGGDDWFANETTGAIIADEPIRLNNYDGAYLKFNDTTTNKLTGIKRDVDGDGRVDGPDDYIVYNEVYIYDALAGEIKLAYDPGFVGVGNISQIRGVDYVLAKIVDTDEVQVAPVTKKTLTNDSERNRDFAVPFIDDWKAQYVGDNSSGNLYLWNDDGYQGSIPITSSSYNVTDAAPDAFKDVYYIWVDLQSDGTLKAWIARKEEAADNSLVDGQSALGYAKVEVKTDGKNKVKRLHFLSDIITLVRDESVSLDEEGYMVDYTDKELSIQRESETVVASGQTLKSTKKPYNNFLKRTVTMTVTGGEEKAPELEIVNEDEADKDMNLVLIGGPVANKLTEELVTAGKSTVDWYNSDGDIEVIEDAFGTGAYAIIVAGKTREETRAAAEALADAL